jgi:hypothetical protein
MTFSGWLLLGMLIFATTVAHAENGCPPGFQQTGSAPSAQDPVGCRPIEENGRQVSSPQPRWAALWGAISTDGDGGFGSATNMASRKNAENSALASCEAKAKSSKCKIDLSYVNQCAAMIAGDTGYNTQAGLTVDLAVQQGMRICSAATTHCYAYYTACSLPMRIQ